MESTYDETEMSEVAKFEKSDEQLRLFAQNHRAIFESFGELVDERNVCLEKAKNEVKKTKRSKGSILYQPRREREYNVGALRKEIKPSLFNLVTTVKVDLKAFDAAAKKGDITSDQVEKVTVSDEKKPAVKAPKPIVLGELL